MTFKKGDIVLPQDRTHDSKKLRHPAVVWEDSVDGDMIFQGIMLTSSPPRNGYDNVLMESGHFCTGFTIVYKNSHFVNQIFLKIPAWGPFEKVGQLTTEGILFLEQNISKRPPESFDSYVAWRNGSP